MGVALKVKGADKVRARLVRMASRASDLTPFLKGRSETLQTAMKMGIEGSVTPWGKAFRFNSPVTVERKRKKSTKPLVDTGRLGNALYAKPLGPDSIQFGVVAGEQAQYGRVNLFGAANNKMYNRRDGSGNPAPIPARPFLPVDQSGRPDFRKGGWAAVWMQRMRAKLKVYLEGKSDRGAE